MQIQNKISPAVIAATTQLLQPYCPDLSPSNLIAALKAWEDESEKPKKPVIEKLLTRFEVAELLSVSLTTVNRMINDGRLQKIKLSSRPHGSVRIDPASVRVLLNETRTTEPGEEKEVN